MDIEPISGQKILDDHDVKAVLARNSVGRLGFIRHDEIDILPIQYVYKAGSIFGRTSPTGKLSKMQRTGTKVAFEVDEVHSTHDWVSVLTHGTFRIVDRQDEAAWQEALRIVRQLHHDAFTDKDAKSHQSELFEIVIRNATGRALSDT